MTLNKSQSEAAKNVLKVLKVKINNAALDRYSKEVVNDLIEDVIRYSITIQKPVTTLPAPKDETASDYLRRRTFG